MEVVMKRERAHSPRLKKLHVREWPKRVVTTEVPDTLQAAVDTEENAKHYRVDARELNLYRADAVETFM